MATLTELLDHKVARVRQAHWPAGQYLEIQYEPTRRAILHRTNAESRDINLRQLIQESSHLDYREATAADDPEASAEPRPAEPQP